jgi:hypothetical protein
MGGRQGGTLIGSGEDETMHARSSRQQSSQAEQRTVPAQPAGGRRVQCGLFDFLGRLPQPVIGVQRGRLRKVHFIWRRSEEEHAAQPSRFRQPRPMHDPCRSNCASQIPHRGPQPRYGSSRACHELELLARGLPDLYAVFVRLSIDLGDRCSGQGASGASHPDPGNSGPRAQARAGSWPMPHAQPPRPITTTHHELVRRRGERLFHCAGVRTEWRCLFQLESCVG